MTDIMAKFKESKFVVVPNDYEDSFEHLVVLSDIAYWSENLESLIEWCDENECEVLGMTVNVPDDQRLIVFILRWE
jgi:hypothetical protein